MYTDWLRKWHDIDKNSIPSSGEGKEKKIRYSQNWQILIPLTKSSAFCRIELS